MEASITLMVAGLFIILISQTFAKLIGMKSQSKIIEFGLRVFLVLFGLVFFVLGLLIALGVLEVISNFPKETSYAFIVLGAISIISTPFTVNMILKKHPDNEYVKMIGKRRFYVYFIGIGVYALTIGITCLIS